MKYPIRLFKTLILGLSLLCCFPIYAGSNNAGGVGAANVKFGSPDGSGENCSGKGVCMLSSIVSLHSKEIPVTFTYVPTMGGDDFSTLSFQFSIQALEEVDRDYLYTYFLYPDGRARYDFKFEKAYTFTDKYLCENLGVEVGSLTIEPSNSSMIETLFGTDVRVTYKIPNR